MRETSGQRKSLPCSHAPGQFVTAVQIGINTVAILAGAVGESALSPSFSDLIKPVYDGPWLEPCPPPCRSWP